MYIHVISDSPLIVVLANSGEALIGRKGMRYLSRLVSFINFKSSHGSVDAVFFCATLDGEQLV